jgi:hypothetical protein
VGSERLRGSAWVHDHPPAQQDAEHDTSTGTTSPADRRADLSAARHFRHIRPSRAGLLGFVQLATLDINPGFFLSLHKVCSHRRRMSLTGRKLRANTITSGVGERQDAARAARHQWPKVVGRTAHVECRLATFILLWHTMQNSRLYHAKVEMPPNVRQRPANTRSFCCRCCPPRSFVCSPAGAEACRS